MAAAKLPEVRQCTDEDDRAFGCTATEGAGRQEGLWMIANPATGGHWVEPDEVSEWKVLSEREA